MIDVAKLRATAKAASPVRWFLPPKSNALVYLPLIEFGDRRDESERIMAHAAFIDATQPECVLALCDEVERLRAVKAAAEALGAMPEGYCFCSKDRVGDDGKAHEPECRDLRAAIAEASR